MAGKAANLSIGIVADDSKFLDGLGRATRAAEAFEKNMNARTIAIGTAIGNNLGDAARQLITAFPQAFSAAVDAMDAFNDLRDTTGASIENISALDAIGRRTGATFEDVSSSLVKFNKTLQESGDNVGGDIFRELGLDLDKLKKMDPAEAFLETAKAIQRIEDPIVKGHIQLELFGKAAGKIAPFLNDVADAGQLVASTTEAQAQAAEDYNKAIAKFQAETQDAVRTLANDLLPALTSVIKSFGEGGGAVAALGTFLKEIIPLIAVVGASFNQAGRQLGGWAAQIAALGRGDLDGFNLISDAVKKDAERARLEFLAFERSVKDSGKSLSELGVPSASYSNEGRGQSAGSGKKTRDVAELERQRKADEEAGKARAKAADQAAAAIARAQEGARKYVDNIEKQIFKTRELSEVEKVLDDIAARRVQFRDAAAAGAAVDAASRLDAAKAAEAYAKSQEESAKRLADAQKQIAAEVQGLYDATRTPAEEYQARLVRLNELLENGHLTQDLFRRATEQATEAFVKSTEKIDEMSVAAKRYQENIQDALGNLLEEGLSGNFDNIVADFGKMLAKMAAQALAADITGKITGGNTNNTAALFKGIGGLFGSGTGSGIGNAGAGDYKSFYDSMAGLAVGTNYIPEDGMYKLHRGEAVQPKKYNPAAGGQANGGNVVVNNHGADVQQKQNSDGDIVLTVRNIARSMMLEDMARGGEISQAGRQTLGWQRQNPRR